MLLAAAAGLARDHGAETVVWEFRERPLPMYDADLEAGSGFPAEVAALRAAAMKADGLLLASPEYNAGVSPLMKNAVDWLSRPGADAGGGNVLVGKTALLISASPGALGGIRALQHLRLSLATLDVFVMPAEVAVPRAAEAFDEGRNLVSEPARKRLEAAVGRFVETTRRLAARSQ
jgi:chromate reductase